MIPQTPTDSASFLSIGCGAGELDVNILAAGKAHASAVAYVWPDLRECQDSRLM